MSMHTGMVPYHYNLHRYTVFDTNTFFFLPHRRQEAYKTAVVLDVCRYLTIVCIVLCSVCMAGVIVSFRGFRSFAGSGSLCCCMWCIGAGCGLRMKAASLLVCSLLLLAVAATANTRREIAVESEIENDLAHELQALGGATEPAALAEVESEADAETENDSEIESEADSEAEAEAGVETDSESEVERRRRGRRGGRRGRFAPKWRLGGRRGRGRGRRGGAGGEGGAADGGAAEGGAENGEGETSANGSPAAESAAEEAAADALENGNGASSDAVPSHAPAVGPAGGAAPVVAKQSKFPPPVNTAPTPGAEAYDCFIKQAKCPNFPQYVGQFKDPFTASYTERQCFQRAKWFHAYCGNSDYTPTTAIFGKTGKSYQHRTFHHHHLLYRYFSVVESPEFLIIFCFSVGGVLFDVKQRYGTRAIKYAYRFSITSRRSAVK